MVDDEVEAAIESLVPLAPLHNPANLEGIKVARKVFPDLPQVAVFDTAFHQTLPPHAYTYAVPRRWAREHGVRRYGFHGTSFRGGLGDYARRQRDGREGGPQRRHVDGPHAPAGSCHGESQW